MKPAIYLEDSIVEQKDGVRNVTANQYSDLFDDGATEFSSLTRRKLTNANETNKFFQNQARLDGSIEMTSERQTTAAN